MKGDREANVGVEKEGVMRRGKLAAPGSCRGRQATSSLKPLEKMQLSQHPDLSPVKPILDLGFQNCNRINVWYVKPLHCGNSSQQSWEMNIVSILE